RVRRDRSSYSLLLPPPPRPTLFPYTTLFRSIPFAPSEESAQAQNTTGTTPSGMPQQLPAEQSYIENILRLNQGKEDSVVPVVFRSEEHTSELQSRFDLVCRLLLEKKKSQPLQ